MVGLLCAMCWRVCCSCNRDTATDSHSRCVCRAFTAAAVQQAVDAKQLGLAGLRQLLQMYEQQLADVTAIPSTV